MVYIKTFNSKQAAIDATDIIAPNITCCKETSQTLIGGGNLPDDTQMDIVADGPDKIKYLEQEHYFVLTYSTQGGQTTMQLRMDEGMTFRQWIVSAYNVVPIGDDNQKAIVSDDNKIQWPYSTEYLYNTSTPDDFVFADDLIVENKTYLKILQIL